MALLTSLHCGCNIHLHRRTSFAALRLHFRPNPPDCGRSISTARFSLLPFLSLHSSIRLYTYILQYIHTSTYIYNLMHWCAYNERDWHKCALNAHGTRHFLWQTGVQSETYTTHIPKGTERQQRVQRWQVVVAVVVVVVVAAQLELRPAFACLLVLQFVPHVAVRFAVWPYVLCALIEFTTCLCECCHMPHSSEQGRWANHFKTLATKVTTLFVY